MNKSYLKYLILIGAIILQSCQKEELILSGHWHVYSLNAEDKSRYEFQTIDFENDSLIVLGKHMFHDCIGLEGYHDQKNKILYFGGECDMANFKYEIDGNQLKLSLLNGGSDLNLKAEKCFNSCCDRQKEYFWGKKVSIDLPVYNNQQELEDLKVGRQIKVHFGIPLLQYQSEYSNGHRLVIGDKFSTLEDLYIWNEQTIIQIPVNERDEISNVIYADKETNMSLISSIVKKWSSQNYENFYIALRSKNTGPGFHVKYLKFSTSTNKLKSINTNCLLKNWIKEECTWKK